MTVKFRDHLESHLGDLRERFEEIRGEIAPLCESPIELAFADAIICCNTVLECRLPHLVLPLEPFPATPGFYVAPQRRIGDFRVDFALQFTSGGGRPGRLVVECDGHDFHEKTKEQARRDKSRDRWLMGREWPVHRFTGSEIYADPMACAEQAAGQLFDNWVKENGGHL